VAKDFVTFGSKYVVVAPDQTLEVNLMNTYFIEFMQVNTKRSRQNQVNASKSEIVS